MTAETEPQLDLAEGYWASQAEIARIKGVSRQAVSKRVAALKAEGKLQTKDGPAGAVLVNVAQFDFATGEAGDPAKELGNESRDAIEDDAPAPSAGGDPTYRDAATREKQYRADLLELQVKQQLGELVPVAKLADDVAKCAEAIVAVIERLPQGADECAAAVAREGAAGARAYLKKSARATRVAIVAALQKLVADTQGKDDAALPIDEPVTLLWGDLDPAAHVAPDHA